MNGHVVSLSYQTRRKVWRFPKDRFVEYGPEDESYCRLAGFGREEEVTETICIPRAVITDLRWTPSRAEMSFEAMPAEATFEALCYFQEVE
jgi:hypothetical protein